MRTARSLIASRSIHLEGTCMPGGVHAQGGHACEGDVRATHPHPPVNRMTDACENITLPQTSFAGGNNLIKENNFLNQNYWTILERNLK